MLKPNERRLRNRIDELRKRRNAVILAHNYQLGEVQDIADFVGDSLELSRKARESTASLIVFCGVHFMAETAAILCPERTVLLPVKQAGCPMADMVTATRLREEKQKHPRARVVCYVNSTAEVKAESDICCTSANAERILKSVAPEEEIIFVPDQYLGEHAALLSKRKVHLWPGFCPTHVRILPEHIQKKKEQYPEAAVIVHPECRRQVREMADAVLSTGQMVRFARQANCSTIIVGTEIGIIHRLQKENPHKTFVPATEQAICPNMKLISLENVLWALENLKHRITVPEPVRQRAASAIEKMLSL